jgi:two-component system, sensor histidine kinase YesM
LAAGGGDAKMLRRMSFGKRIFLIFATLSCCVIFSSSIIYYLYAYNENNKVAANDFNETVAKTTQQLDELISNMDVVSSQVIANKSIQQVFMNIELQDERNTNHFEQDINDRSLVQGILWSYNSPREIVENINVFTPPATFVGLMSLPPLNQVRSVAAFSKWDEGDFHSTKYRLLPPHEDDWGVLVDQEPVISLVRPLTLTYFNFDNVATIEVQQAYSKIEAICNWKSAKQGMRLLVVDDQNNLIYPYQDAESENNRTLAGDILKATDKLPSGELNEIELPQYNERVMTTYGELNNANWKVILIQPRSDYLENVNNVLTIIIGVGVVFTAIITVIIFLITNSITKPLVQLRRSVSKVTLDNQFKMISSTEVDEIELLQTAFYEITEQIKQSAYLLVKANESQLQLKIAELQSKINPHFLYNSLMAISAAGQEGQSEKVQAMCLQLSELFRYSSSDSAGEVSLNDELNNVATYLEFMKLRYEDNLEFTVEREGNLDCIQIPRLILQPIIENSFTHGYLQVIPPFCLRVSCYVNGDSWKIEVRDNGSGIDEETIAKIEEKMRRVDEILAGKEGFDKLRTDDMALINIYIRLKTLYEDRVEVIVRNDSELSGAYISISVV